MEYIPKHRAEPVIKYRVHFMESERGWGQDYWDRDYDTAEEAQAAFDKCNSLNTHAFAPDHYIVATNIDIIML